MKVTWRRLILFVVLAIILGLFLLLPPSRTAVVSARLMVQTNDANGQPHIVYELSNATYHTHSLRINESGLEFSNDWTLCWSNRILQPRPIGSPQDIIVNCPASLNPRAVTNVELILSPSFHHASAIRGRVWHIKEESKITLQIRTIIRKAGIPSSWLMWPKPAFLELPPANLAIDKPQKNASSKSPVSSLDAPSEALFPAGSIKFQQGELHIVLQIYAEIASATLDVDQRIKNMSARVTVENSEPLTQAAVLSLLEKALQQQAGIRITRLDRQHIKVTSDAPLESH